MKVFIIKEENLKDYINRVINKLAKLLQPIDIDSFSNTYILPC